VRALITGGAGFIGSHLSEALLEQGDQVLIIDNLSTGSFDNIAHLKGRAGFEYFIDSVENEPLLAELIDRSDVVFHFAAAVGVKLIVEQPVYTIETNVHGTEVVLKHANKKKKLVVIAGPLPEPRRVFQKANLEVAHDHVFLADTLEEGIQLAQDLIVLTPDSVTVPRPVFVSDPVLLAPTPITDEMDNVSVGFGVLRVKAAFNPIAWALIVLLAPLAVRVVPTD